MKTVFFIFILFFSVQNLDSQKLTQSDLENIFGRQGVFSSVSVGFSAFKDKNEILSYNSEKLFIPASTLKIFYTLSAIQQYGNDFKYKTNFYYQGDILEDGTLEGDLLIYAGGDPTLGSMRFYDDGIGTVFKIIKRGFKKNGISCIDGDIVLVNESKSYPVNGSWSYEDIGNYYAGGYYPLNFNDNEYVLSFETGNNSNDPTKIISIVPQIYGLEINNYVRTGEYGSGDNAYIYGIPYSNYREVKGTLPPGRKNFEIKGSMPNPPETFMYLLSDYFDDEKIMYNNLRVNSYTYENKKFLFSIVSPKLLDIAKECNDYSVNLYSEALAQLLCLNTNHPNEYISKEEFFDFFSKYNFIQVENQIVDGCGLSSENIISPKSMNSFIDFMVGKLGIEEVKDIFPRAGVDGNFKNIFNKNDNIWMKSGSISGVLNYTGIVETNNGDIIFTVMVNHIPRNNTKSIKKELLRIIKMLK